MNITEHKHYRRWHNVRQRCENPNHAFYKDYGGRGITVAEELKSSRDFCEYLDSLPGWAPGMTLDRIDNDRGYEVGNLRWVCNSVQQGNKRSYGKGYYWNKRDEKFQVQWNVKGERRNHGYYKTEAEAREVARQTCPGKYRY